ncbi:MAG: thioesterase family protein [Thiofilum sp.]|uniref:acyl-CoA thioesterase n=1 Tax=Thiofilum sp. TaxID=2212733 RepID=UPI0025E85675|nr:thioesterase family protein [Thiofilum sp.]
MEAESMPTYWVYSCEIPVRWGDMDAYGHVNNTVYFRFLEEARVQMLADWGAGDIHNSTIAPVIINAGCTFLRPIDYPNTVKVDCYIGQLGRSSVMTYYKVYTVSNPEIVTTEGYAKTVWMDHSTGKSAPIPDPIRARLEQFMQVS